MFPFGFFFLMETGHTTDLVFMQAHPFADNPYCWQLPENMVSLLHVPLFDSDRSSSHTFFLLLSGTSFHPFSDIAKALEGQATFKSTG